MPHGVPRAAPKPWPKLIQRDPRLAANAAACDACPELARFTDGRPYCRLEPGDPCVNRLYAVIQLGQCRIKKHAQPDAGV